MPFVRPVILALVFGLAACSGQDGRERAAAELDGSPPIRASGPVVDDWTTFAHDALRTGYQPQLVAITKRNVRSLRLRWMVQTGGSFQASPLVVRGVVYAALNDGRVMALSSATGRTLWQRATGMRIAMTPSLADGLLFVGDHRAPGAFVALDAKTGVTRWSTPLRGGVRSEPIVTGGLVYEGETGGDAPLCHESGLIALDERTGRERYEWHVDPRPHNGGAVWSPISFDGTHVIFGTGNSCEGRNPTSNSVVALDRSGTPAWFVSTAKASSDSDVGGGTLVLHGQGLVTSKNGRLYDIDLREGHVNWTTMLDNVAGYGGIGTPSTDGTTIVAESGFASDPTTDPKSPGGSLEGLDTQGNVRWAVRAHHPIYGSASIANGIAYTALDDAFTALDLRTGARLWTYPISTPTYASPAIVPSGLYFADEGGRVYAFAVPHA